jgi:hypothetical protein
VCTEPMRIVIVETTSNLGQMEKRTFQCTRCGRTAGRTEHAAELSAALHHFLEQHSVERFQH